MMRNDVFTLYGTRTDEYIDAVGRIEHAAEADREAIRSWACARDGRVLDIGSGPGQWTHFLRREGVDVLGIEPTPEFLIRAERDYPQSMYRAGRAEQLDVPDGSIAGILAWFSLIHTPPSELDPIFTEFSRALTSDGSIMLGFFSGDELAEFDHAIAPAFFWPVDALCARLLAAGFVIGATDTRREPGRRQVSRIVASIGVQ